MSSIFGVLIQKKPSDVLSEGFFCLFKFKCAGIELIVGALFGDEFFVAAAFDDSAMV